MAFENNPDEVTLETRKAQVDALGRRVKRLHRGILEPDVLKGLLPLRARTLAHRGEQRENRERAARFLDAAPSYARSLSDDGVIGGRAVVVDLDGLRWWVPLLQPDDEAAVQRYLTHQDFPYRAITQTREVAVGGIMLDIGANIGRMSIPRVILGDVTAAYCAEPDPLNFACLARNVHDNQLEGMVLPDHVAIAAENGSVHLQRANSAGGHRVVDSLARSKRGTVDVPALTLDTWTERLGINLQDLSFVKVDAQGSELHILRGAQRVLACRHVAWQIEIDVPLLGRRGFTAEDLFSTLRTHFTHFVDLNRRVTGPRVRRIADLAAALEYIVVARGGRTDVLVFNLQSAGASSRPGRLRSE